MNNRHRRNGKRHTSYLSTKSTSETLFHQLASSCVILSLGGYGRFPAGACVLAEQGEKLKQDPLEFIPGWLDDLGLPSNQFRVLCHISRRGNCFASLTSIAATTRLTRKTVQDCLAALLERGLIFKQSRIGKTSLYSRKPRAKEVLGEAHTQDDPSTESQGKERTEHLGHSTYCEGSKREGDPIKGKRPLSSFEDWQLTKDEEKLTSKIQRLKEADLPDQPLINFHVQSRKAIREEQRRRGTV